MSKNDLLERIDYLPTLSLMLMVEQRFLVEKLLTRKIKKKGSRVTVIPNIKDSPGSESKRYNIEIR